MEANDPNLAEQMAIEAVEAELRLEDIIENKSSDPPRILVEEIRCVESFDPSIATKGFTFYMDDELRH